MRGIGSLGAGRAQSSHPAALVSRGRATVLDLGYGGILVGVGDPDPWAKTIAWQVIRHADLAHDNAHAHDHEAWSQARA